ncbi:MAG: hypothetical protein GY870_06925 [archaeon]|nr:hypothetical protein [archaeon]
MADRPIPGSAIRIQQSDLSREQKLDAMITQQNYNNALVELQISQGNFQRAEQIVQETADDALQSFQFQLEALKAQGVIEEQEAARLEEQGQFERNLALEGFVALSPEQAQAFSPTELFTDPITGKSYLKPTGADLTPAEQELQELDILSKKLGIEAQMLKNQLIGDDSFQTTVTTGDGMFRVTYDKNGNEINRSRIGDSPAGTKQPSATQFEAAGFAARIEQAESMLNDLAGVGTGLGEAFGARNLPNLFKGENRKRFEQAERNFINSQLRRESGAAIADSEFESARLQYIPQPGDGEATLKQKADNRATVLNSLKLEAGNALPGATSQGGVTNTEDLFN